MDESSLDDSEVPVMAKPLESVWVADDFPVAEDLLVEVVVVAFTRVGSVAPHCLPEAQRLMHVASPLQAVWQSSTSIRQMKNGMVWEYLLTTIRIYAK